MSGDVAPFTRLYRAVLEIALAADPDTAITQITEVLVDFTEATAGFVEIHIHGLQRTYAHGKNGAMSALRAASHDLFAHVVRRDALGAELPGQHVLLAPIGTRKHIGMIALQRSAAARAFNDAERDVLRFVATQFALVADELVATGVMRLRDEVRALQTRRIRESLLRHHGNVSEVARELAVGRSLVYRVIGRSRSKED